jgi:hypothetical protein
MYLCALEELLAVDGRGVDDRHVPLHVRRPAQRGRPLGIPAMTQS